MESRNPHHQMPHQHGQLHAAVLRQHPRSGRERGTAVVAVPLLVVPGELARAEVPRAAGLQWDAQLEAGGCGRAVLAGQRQDCMIEGGRVGMRRYVGRSDGLPDDRVDWQALDRTQVFGKCIHPAFNGKQMAWGAADRGQSGC